LVSEFLDRSHVWRVGPVTAVGIDSAHGATGSRDDRYRWVGRTDPRRGVPLGVKDEASGIDLHFFGRDHETEVVKEEEV
jgi:hypothetical protein